MLDNFWVSLRKDLINFFNGNSLETEQNVNWSRQTDNNTRSVPLDQTIPIVIIESASNKDETPITNTDIGSNTHSAPSDSPTPSETEAIDTAEKINVENNQTAITSAAIAEKDKQIEQLELILSNLLQEKNRLADENVDILDKNRSLEAENQRLTNEMKALSDEFEEKQSAFEKKIKQLEDSLHVYKERLEFYIQNRDLPNAICGDIGKLNASFGETTQYIRKLIDMVTYGDSGVKQLCSLWKTISPIDDEYVKVISESIKQILTDSFNVEWITPVPGEQFNTMLHEATIYNSFASTVKKCLQSGCKYNDKVIIKAIVEI